MGEAVNAGRWSLNSYFSVFGGPDYRAFRADLETDLAALRESVGAGPLAEAINTYEGLVARFGHLSSYVGCLAADDAGNDAVKAEEASLAKLGADFTKVYAELAARLVGMTDDKASDLERDPLLAGAEFPVRRMRAQGARMMPPADEALAADLNVDGLHAWGRLYDTLSGRLSFAMTFPDGHVETVPMARRRAFMADPDRSLRAAAFRDGQTPWETHADTFAAALNGIAGTRLSLARRRGGRHFLDQPAFDSALDPTTLDALMRALRENVELSHRALRAAARLQGEPLHFFDLEAPQVRAPEGVEFSWTDACALVRRSFHGAYPALGDFFDVMLERRWIEAQPRAGKRSGAFCSGSRWSGEQRVFMTHGGTIHDVITLAHEVGHAWHSRVLRGARPLAAGYPMTLAETASNFGEMILLDGLERDPASSPALIAYLLDQQINRAHAYLVNIPMRFEFERRFYEARQAGEISAPALRDLMVAAQREWYGDTLADDGCDPMFWASKLHFFISGLGFYNFPYAFGYLLGQGLFARFRAEGAAFLPRYEEFLRRTGSATCEDVAREVLNVEIDQVGAWTSILQTLEPLVVRYEALAAG